MCDIYTSADPIHYEQRTRSMRIRGVVTSIRLENLCWDILARIASKDQMTTNQLISKLYDEIIGGPVPSDRGDGADVHEAGSFSQSIPTGMTKAKAQTKVNRGHPRGRGRGRGRAHAAMVPGTPTLPVPAAHQWTAWTGRRLH